MLNFLAVSALFFAQGWYRFVTWPEGITAWAIILTLIVIGWQSWETRKSAEAARLNAQTAEKQLELMRAEARARLEVQPGDIEVIAEEGHPYWYIETYIRLRNVGKSSAYIVRCLGEFFVREGAKPIEARSFDGRSLDASSAVVEPSATIICGPTIAEFDDCSIRDIADSIAQMEVYPIFRGFVEYETQGTKWRRDFGYCWIDNSSNRAKESGFTFPPNAIERMRDGSWEIDPDQKNGEHQNPN